MNDIFYAYELEGLTPEFNVANPATTHEYSSYGAALQGAEEELNEMHVIDAKGRFRVWDAIITCYEQDENGRLTVINQTTENIELTN
jgi:hypothetical protein